MVKRIAAAGEHFAVAGWREDAGFLLFHFPTWAKARAMQHWIDRSGIARRQCRRLSMGYSFASEAAHRRRRGGREITRPCARLGKVAGRRTGPR